MNINFENHLIPESLYYINNKTYVGHVSSLKSIVNDMNRNISSKRTIAIVSPNDSYFLSDDILSFLEKNNFSELVEIVTREEKDNVSLVNLVNNEHKSILLFEDKKELLDVVVNYNYAVYNQLNNNFNNKDFNEYLFTLFGKSLIFGELISEDDITNTKLNKNMELSFNSKEISFDILFYLLNKDKITNQTVETFVEKISSVREKMILEQIETTGSNDLFALIVSSKKLNMNDKEKNVIKNMFKGINFSNIVEIKNVLDKYHTKSNLEKLKNFSPLLSQVFNEYKESYDIQMKLFNINAYELKNIPAKERQEFIFAIYDHMMFFSRRDTRVSYLPYV